MIFGDPTIEAVFICSSTATHADFIMRAAQTGKHIFCEKPIDTKLAKIEEALAAVKKAGVKLQVASCAALTTTTSRPRYGRFRQAGQAQSHQGHLP